MPNNLTGAPKEITPKKISTSDKPKIGRDFKYRTKHFLKETGRFFLYLIGGIIIISCIFPPLLISILLKIEGMFKSTTETISNLIGNFLLVIYVIIILGGIVGAIVALTLVLLKFFNFRKLNRK